VPIAIKYFKIRLSQKPALSTALTTVCLGAIRRMCRPLTLLYSRAFGGVFALAAISTGIAFKLWW
jgi:hypothetical protein